MNITTHSRQVVLSLVTLAITVFSSALAICEETSQANSFAIRNATIYNTNHEVITGNIIVKQGKISAIGATAIPSGFKVIDASNGSVTPGLFNAITHIGVEEVSQIPETVDKLTLDPRITASLKIADAFNFRSTAIGINRSQGLTHALVLPSSGTSLIAGQAALIDLSGSRQSVIDDFAALVVNLGEQGQALAGGSRAAAMLQLKEAFQDARDYMANKAQFNQGQRRTYALSRLDLDALSTVISQQKPVIIQVNRAADILNVLEFVKEENISAALLNAEEAWIVADKIAEAKVPVIIDPIRNIPSHYESLGARSDNAALLHQAGVKLIFSGKDWRSTHSAYLVRQSAGNAVASGLDKSAAIQAMTSNPAEVFAKGKIPAELKIGETANFVVWSGDPLELTSEPLSVIINGQLSSLETRSQKLAERYLKKNQQAKH
ncbi:Adenine deaminase [Thalassocella blandensis]|nr:Adenine deaminase [Thalassocella blandensis]